MTPKQRIMTALSLLEPDKVPFADWTDPEVRGWLNHALGYDDLDDDAFCLKMGLDAICYVQDMYMATPVLPKNHRRQKSTAYGNYPIRLP